LGKKVEFEKSLRIKTSEMVYKIISLSIVMGILRDQSMPSFKTLEEELN